MGQWVVLYNQQKKCRGFESHRLHISAFFREKQKKEMTSFASVRAGDVNDHDSLFPSTTVVRGEGREPRRYPGTKSVRVNWRTRKHVFRWLYIELPTGPRSQ